LQPLHAVETVKPASEVAKHYAKVVSKYEEEEDQEFPEDWQEGG